MSRKNKSYGRTWLEWDYSLLGNRRKLVLYAWTHMPAGRWWAPMSRTVVESYVVGTFESINEYKQWRRNRFKSSLARFLMHGKID